MKEEWVVLKDGILVQQCLYLVALRVQEEGGERTVVAIFASVVDVLCFEL